MSGLRDLLRQVSHYSLSNLLVMVGGVISFPILTRLLSVAEYGIMGLNVLIIFLPVTLGKLGLQHSSVRLWPEWERKEGGAETYVLTLFIASVCLCLPVVLLFDGVVLVLRPWIGERLSFYILLYSPIILTTVLNSYGLNLLRARELSRARGAFDVVTHYSAMFLSLSGAYLGTRGILGVGGLGGFYLGQILGQAVVSTALLVFVLRWTRWRRANWSTPLLREALVFGVPMAIWEACGVLFSMGDRLIIQWLLDETALGYYTVAFNLAQYINTLFTLPVEMAAVPMYTNLFEREGEAAAAEFLRTSTRFFFLFALPCLAGIVVIREDILVVMASPRFLPGSELVHFLLAGFLLYGSQSLLGAGMFLRKRPWQMAGIELFATGLNIGLCFLLIPRWGIRGAALAALSSQAIMALTCWALGSRLVRVPIDLYALLLHALCATGMAVGIHFVDPGPGVVRLVLRIVAGAGLYGLLVVMVDREARAVMRKVWARIGGGQQE